LEGEAIEELMPDEENQSEGPHYEEGEAENLFYLCDRSDQQLERIALEAWEGTVESHVYRTCLAIRARAFAGTLPNLTDSKKQQMLNDMQKLKDNNDWTLDPKHVYRRSILRKKAPSWADSTERIERHYRPIWNPEQLRKQWCEPTEVDYWAFQKSSSSDGSKIDTELVSFMSSGLHVESAQVQKREFSDSSNESVDQSTSKEKSGSPLVVLWSSDSSDESENSRFCTCALST
jgi:hypothetical protein